MGTRNLTLVNDQNGTKKVAQYGQWDGYPSGVGANILNFLHDKELFENFKSNLSKVRFLDVEGIDKDFVEKFNNEPTKEQEVWHETFLSRDLAAKVLQNIANSEDSEILLQDKSNTSPVWIEWSYLIDLKENTLSVFEGVPNDEPLKVYSLNSLPSKASFITDLEGSEE
jgi:hypothetical protein